MNLFGNLFNKKERERISGETLQELGFNEEVQVVIKEAAGMEFYPLENYHEVTIGIYFKCSQGEAEQLVDQLRAEIQPLGYLPFIAETDVGWRSNSIIGIVKTDSPFELLKILETNGDNYDISNEDVIVKLKEWHQRNPFTVTGANFDWVEIAFEKLPARAELTALAKEVTVFCPDAVEFDEDEVSIEETVKSMEETKKIFLWWD